MRDSKVVYWNSAKIATAIKVSFPRVGINFLCSMEVLPNLLTKIVLIVVAWTQKSADSVEIFLPQGEECI